MKADSAIVTKSIFATVAGVSRGRVAQWISDGKIGGDALIGQGRRARVRVEVALAQLKRNLDPSQHLGANGRALIDGNGNGNGNGDITDAIRAARLRQLDLINSRLAAEEATRCGALIKTDAVRQEIGRTNGRWLALTESSLTEFANAIAAEKPATPRDTLAVLRTRWRQIREREAKAQRNEAIGMADLVGNGATDADGQR